MTRIKICGLTNLADALNAAELGAHALGFVFAESPRQLTVAEASEICTKLPPYVARVGVFVDSSPERIEEIYHQCNLSEVQLYDSATDLELKPSPNVPYLRSFRVRDEQVLKRIADLSLDRFHLDSYHPNRAGGTGVAFDWDIAAEASRLGQLILAGGLNPENITSALEKVRPYGVDVSSGVEKEPGKKDFAKLKQFIKKVRQWDNRIN